MCGIAGAVAGLSSPSEAVAGTEPGRARQSCVQKISAALQHRGPDGDGLWSSPAEEVVFAHRRLAIIDLSDAGAQPMVDPGTGCVISFNGEIYNFRELRAELESAGESFESRTDTEVVLKAYKHWGLDAVRRLRGIFAIALWDPRSRVVHLVRDHQGIKPLYWTEVRNESLGGETLLFSSELRALLASDVVERRLDPSGVASYLFQGFVVGPGTIVDGVRLLPAGTILTISGGESEGAPNRREFQRYWSLPTKPKRQISESELREVLVDAVGSQLVSDAPLGIFLSGGIDSSAVAALASAGSSDPVHTFTIGFDEDGLDESPFAEKVSEAIGSEHKCVTLREQDFLHQLPDALDSIDQPTFDAINTYFVSRAAREAGMTVALAGTGGDELFGGYPTFSELPKMLRGTKWIPGRTFGGAIRFGSKLVGSAFWSVLRQSPPQTRWGKIADVVRAAHDLNDLYQVSYAIFTDETQARLATQSVRAAQREQEFGLPRECARDRRAMIEGAEPRHAVSLLELSSFIGERLLRDTDAASMAVALEVRVPLLDHLLCEAVAGVDADRRFSPPGKKQLLRDLALSDLDPSLFDRPKSGFVLPIDRWARQRLKPEIDQAFADDDLIRSVGLQPSAVRTLWASYQAGKPGMYWSRVWAIYVLLAWCKRHDMRLAP